MSSILDTADALAQTDAEDSPDSAEARAEESKEGLTLYHDKWPVAISGDYDEFIRFFGYDPADWTVEDTGTMSKWQQSKGRRDGSRDVIWLYSYKGVKFCRKTPESLLTEVQFTSAVASVSSSTIRRTLGCGLGPEVSYVHLQGDEQGGKFEGGGIKGLEEREAMGLESSVAHLKSLMRQGKNITTIGDVQTGDKIENIFGHYSNQPRTTATMRAQNAYAIQSEVRRIKEFATFDLPILLPRTPSNHGEHRPAVGVSPMTSASDNLDLQIAETVKMVLDETQISDQLTWVIPHDEVITTFELAGVNCALTHGHVIRGAGTKAIADWVTAQRNKYAFHRDHKIRMFFMGHFHHFYVEELSGTTALMCGSLDGGSTYFDNMTGKVATPGLAGMTVCAGDPLGFSNLSFL